LFWGNEEAVSRLVQLTGRLWNLIIMMVWMIIIIIMVRMMVVFGECGE
jgi:hypothetical protein